MGSEQLVGVMKMVGSGRRNVSPEMAEALATQFKEKLDEETSAWFCTSKMIDDGVIDPRDTRDVLGMCLSVIHNSEITQGGGFYGIHRM
jgi:acetyl-CoA carboxylase carboxyltransferase component